MHAKNIKVNCKDDFSLPDTCQMQLHYVCSVNSSAALFTYLEQFPYGDIPLKKFMTQKYLM